MKNRVWTIGLFVFFIVSLGVLSYAQQEHKNEMPMYGGGPLTVEEKKINEEFVNGITGVLGSKDRAFEETVAAGWLKFFKGQYNASMRRFNQAWLINPENPQSFLGFAQISLKRKEPEQAVKFLRKAAGGGIPAAQNLLGLFYEEGFGLDDKHIVIAKDLATAEIWFEKADKSGYSGRWKNLRHNGKPNTLKVSEGIIGRFLPIYMVDKIQHKNYRKFTLYNKEFEEGYLITTDDANLFVDTVKKRPPNELNIGLCFILEHNDLYTEQDKEDLRKLSELLTANNIPFFICKTQDLPDGWQSMVGNSVASFGATR